MKAMAKNGQSYLFDDVNPQEWLNKYACNGIIELNRRSNKSNK